MGTWILIDGEWHHIAIIETNNGVIETYVDGELFSTKRGSATQHVVEFAQPQMQKEAENKQSAPHTCPVCGGNGLVSPGFYSQNPGDWMSVTNAHETCRSCNGTGVLWG